MRKLTISLTLLIAPLLLGSLGTVNAAVENSDEATTQVSTQAWTEKTTDQTIHTKNLLGMPVYDKNGVIQERQAVDADTDYHVTAIRTNNQDGSNFLPIR